MEITMETLGEKISLLREERGWTQEDLSIKSKVARRTIQNIEGGKVMSPGVDVVMAISKALGVSVGSILESEKNRAETILEIQSLLTQLSDDDLEIVKMTAEGRLELSQSEKAKKAE